MPISLASETTLRMTNCDAKYICTQYANFLTYQKEFPTVLIIVTRFFLTVSHYWQ